MSGAGYNHYPGAPQPPPVNNPAMNAYYGPGDAAQTQYVSGPAQQQAARNQQLMAPPQREYYPGQPMNVRGRVQNGETMSEINEM